MSPLIRSLLALAALIAAADAQANCNSQTFGNVTESTVQLAEIVTPPGPSRVTADDACPVTYPGYKIAGELVQACNVDENGSAPDIQQVDPEKFSPIDITCPEDGCPKGNRVDITQYCQP